VPLSGSIEDAAVEVVPVKSVLAVEVVTPSSLVEATGDTEVPPSEDAVVDVVPVKSVLAVEVVTPSSSVEATGDTAVPPPESTEDDVVEIVPVESAVAVRQLIPITTVSPLPICSQQQPSHCSVKQSRAKGQIVVLTSSPYNTKLEMMNKEKMSKAILIEKKK